GHDAAILTDGDGTRHSFVRGQGQLQQRFSSPPGSQMLLEAHGSESSAANVDGIAGVRYVVTTADGIAYYFGEDPTQPSIAVSVKRRAHLLARRDRRGNTMRFAYECVAVGSPTTPVSRVVDGTLKPHAAVPR